VVVFAAVPPESAPEESVMDGVRVHRIPMKLETSLAALRREDQRRPFDLFHGFTLLAAYPCLAVAAEGGRPVVASIRGADGMRFGPKIDDVVRGAAWITSVSSDSLSRAMTVRDVGGCSSVIPNGIDIARFGHWSPSEQNAGVVGTVATFRPKKNIPLLIRSYAALPATVRRRLLLVGDAYDGNVLSIARRNDLVALVNELGLSQEVTITGLVDNAVVPEYHLQMRVFVLSSDHEGMPNSLLEAAASGVPIVATAVDGIKDIFTDGQDALIVEPGNVGQLQDAMHRVLTDEKLARHLSEGGRETAARLSPAAELGSYTDLYRRLLADRSVTVRA
jgi:glycosyltransferase involved in cell wall biosynthesis